MTHAPQTSKSNHKDIHQQVTDTITSQLEKGIVPWQQCWKGDKGRLLSIPQNFQTGNKYRGINILLLWCSTINNNYSSHEWATFKQWQQKDEFIRKGEKGSLIVYYDTFEKDVGGEIKEIPFLKSSVVFNRCQLNSYTPEQPQSFEATTEWQSIEAIEDFLQNTKAIVAHGDGFPFYDRLDDKIVMPYQVNFIDTETCTAQEGYYSTLMHELTHWTGHAKRLNRTKGKKFGDHDYALEELIAEFGAAFLCADLGLPVYEKGDHASYIAHWLQVLKENKKFLFTAASEASKAVLYLEELQP